MPEIEFCTAAVPFWAAASDLRATVADSSALVDTLLMAVAIDNTEFEVSRISSDCFSAAASNRVEVSRAASVAFETWAAALLIRPTSTRNSSMV